MLTGDIRSKVDALWNAFWSGGIANPIEIIEQVTYLLFLKRLDDLETLEESKSARLKQPMARRIFPEGTDARGRAYEDMRWSRFKHFAPAEMFTVVSEHVFPFLRTMGGDGSTYAHHMKDARFTVPTPALLAKVVDMIEQVPMEDRDTKGDLYEYMLGKIASAGQNGQFRTPRHIIQLMVEILQPTPWDVMCDLASGTCGFPVAVSEYLHIHHPEIFRDDAMRNHFHNKLFNAFDFDNTMLRIGSMNMLLHGVENPNIRYRDSLAQEHADEVEKYSLILANSPFAGSLDYENCSKDLLQIVKTKKTELLFLALFIRTLKPGGRAAIIVPDGVLFGSSNAHKTLRKILVEDQKLDAVISLPGASSNHTPASPPPSSSSQKPTPAAPTKSSSMMWKPMAGASTTNAARSCPTKNSAPFPQPRSPPGNTQKTTCPRFWGNGGSGMAKIARTAPHSPTAPPNASPCRRPTSPRRATTSR